MLTSVAYFFYLFSRSASGSYGESELYIGGQNAQKYKGDFQWAPLVSKTYWQIKLPNMYCNNGANPKFKVPIASTTAIIDSGTTYIAAPADQAKAFWNSIPNSSTNSGDGFYTFPCAQKIQMTFDFGGGLELTVNELDMNVRTIKNARLERKKNLNDSLIVFHASGVIVREGFTWK